MKRSDAEKLVIFVHDKSAMDALKFYTELRVSYLKDRLTTAATMDEVLKLQGAIEELTRTKHMKEEVLNPKD